MNELTKYLVDECKKQQEYKKRWESNYINLDNYFKYSGQTESHKILISRYVYNENSRCNDLHEKFIKKQEYEKIWKDKANKNYPGRFSAEIEAHCWNETEDSIWSD